MQEVIIRNIHDRKADIEITQLHPTGDGTTPYRRGNTLITSVTVLRKDQLRRAAIRKTQRTLNKRYGRNVSHGDLSITFTDIRSGSKEAAL